MIRRVGQAVTLAVLVAMMSASVDAQAGEGAKFYAEYSAVLAKAKSVDEIVPFLSKSRTAMVQKTPASEMTKMLGMIQIMQPKGVKIVKETTTATGAVLEVTGTGEGGASQTGTVTLVREDSRLKLDKESWKG